MRLIALFLVFVFSYTNKAVCQNNVFYNSKPIDTLRYYGIKGSPYLYKEWQTARIIARDSTILNNVLLNYNGFEQEFEVTQLGRIIVPDENLYDEIIVYLSKTDSTLQEWFVRGVHYDIATQLSNVIYNGTKVILIRSTKVRLSEITDITPAIASVRKKFVQTRCYSIMYKSKLISIRLTKKRIGKVLENKDLVNEIAQNNNLNLSLEKDVIKLLSLIDNQLN